MSTQPLSNFARMGEILSRREQGILQAWLQHQRELLGRRASSGQQQAEQESKDLLAALCAALRAGGTEDLQDPGWLEVRRLLTALSASRARQGYSPGETATFVFSLKQPVFEALREDLGADAAAVVDATWAATRLLDGLGLFTVEAFQKSREEIISRQQQELLELSTPVVQLWDDVIALPLIGTLDSARTQVVMESLLQKIVESGSSIAIIDITGVPTVDTLVAQHLLKTVAAARLMGADCIISGIRPQIAQTIVHLGVDLSTVSTKATLADAFVLALKRTGTNPASLAQIA
jgi:rsbT co-antagonist protein RsbR